MVTILLVSNTILALLLFNRCYEVAKTRFVNKHLIHIIRYSVRDARNIDEEMRLINELSVETKTWVESKQ